MSKVAIIGGGAAGMLCGVYAARRGHQVHILEKNRETWKKAFITGKGRCNVTNDSDTEELFSGSDVKSVNFFTALSTPMEAEM